MNKIVTVGKVPGELHELPIDEQTTIAALFAKINLNVGGCEIQRNGVAADLESVVEPGDTVLAMTKIRGN